MIRPLISCLLGTSCLFALTPQEEIDLKIPAARKIIDAWQEKDPVKAERVLHVILWTPSDREAAPRYRERLHDILHHIRDFYAKEMDRLGFGPRTLKFPYDDDGMIRIHLVKGKEPYANYATGSGYKIRSECFPTLRAAGIDPEKETLVIFCNMSNWDAEKKTISQNSPYYAGGTHRNGTAWQVDSPILDLKFLDQNEPRVRDGQYGDISVGRYNSIFIGGIAHELGHALGLPHNRARQDEAEAFGTALMGSGNRTYGEELRGEGKGSFLTVSEGMRLAAHPIFCGSVKGIDQRANAVPTNLSVRRESKGFVFSGNVKADPPVYGVVAYMDPDGGSDYDATTATAVPDADGNFTLDCQALTPGKTAELRVVFLQANGVASGFLSATPYRYPYSVDRDGKADISAILAPLAMAPFIEAAKENRLEEAEKTLASPAISENPFLLEIGSRVVDSIRGKKYEPVPETLKSLPLSDLPAAEEKVGYGRAVRDRLPEGEILLSGGGRVFRHGFYAHAPARHVWKLDGSWKTLKGHAALAAGRGGSVRFSIHGDGKSLWNSDRVISGLRSYEVDLSGVKELVLTVDDAGDGKGSDWGLWLEPMLER